MKTRLPLVLVLVLTLALLALGLTGCDSANPVAPTGTTLTVTANPTTIALNGTSTITITGFKPDGNRLNPGTQVKVTTTLGTLDATILEADNQGQASTVLRSDGRTGEAEVTVALANDAGGEGSTGATAKVQIGESDASRPTLTIRATPSKIGLGETAEITAIARHADGSVFERGGRIRLHTTLGTLDDEELLTDDNGEVTTTLRTGDDPGTATVTGTIESSNVPGAPPPPSTDGTPGGGSSSGAQVTVTIENQKPTLIISANPSLVDTFETSEITVLARDNNGVPLGAGQRIRLVPDFGTIHCEFCDGSSECDTCTPCTPANACDEVETDSSGEATAIFFAGDQSGSGSVTAYLGSSDGSSVSITIRDAPAVVSLVPADDRVSADGGSLALTVTVLNAAGVTLPNEIVRFETEAINLDDKVVLNEPSFTLDPPSDPATNQAGIASTTIKFSSTALDGLKSFTITAVARETRSTPRKITIGSASSP